jgi:hypothetical protein
MRSSWKWHFHLDFLSFSSTSDSGGDIQWYFSQVKGTMDEEVNESECLVIAGSVSFFSGYFFEKPI